MLVFIQHATEGDAFWIEALQTSTIKAIKQSIMNARGIDVIMQKLVCAGRLLSDDTTLDGISSQSFLVLVTAKPRPQSLLSTGIPLSPSHRLYRSALSTNVESDAYISDIPDGDITDRDGGGFCDDGDGAESVARFVEMGFDPYEADQALRLTSNTHRALALLRAGQGLFVDEPHRLEDRLREQPSFHALQQVVRVDPQIMVRRLSTALTLSISMP